MFSYLRPDDIKFLPTRTSRSEKVKAGESWDWDRLLSGEVFSSVQRCACEEGEDREVTGPHRPER